MSKPLSYASQAESTAQSAAHSRWVELLARFGYAAKGVVYVVIGVLALRVAFGEGGQLTSGEGAIHTIAQQPFGRILLGLIVVGLIGYVIWRFVQSVLDVENYGTDAKGIFKRIALGISAITYGSLAWYSWSILSGSGGGGGSSTQSKTAELMSQPWGLWLVGLLGVIVFGYGLRQFYRSYDASFMDKVAHHEMSRTEKTWGERVGRLGLAARGVVFVMMGTFFVQAAWTANPNEARGLDGALGELATQPYGPWLLGLVAAGLAAYGVYQIFMARYRRMAPGEQGGA